MATKTELETRLAQAERELEQLRADQDAQGEQQKETGDVQSMIDEAFSNGKQQAIEEIKDLYSGDDIEVATITFTSHERREVNEFLAIFHPNLPIALLRLSMALNERK